MWIQRAHDPWWQAVFQYLGLLEEIPDELLADIEANWGPLPSKKRKTESVGKVGPSRVGDGSATSNEVQTDLATPVKKKHQAGAPLDLPTPPLDKASVPRARPAMFGQPAPEESKLKAPGQAAKRAKRAVVEDEAEKVDVETDDLELDEKAEDVNVWGHGRDDRLSLDKVIL